MHILFLGPPCESVLSHLAEQGHVVLQREEVISEAFLAEHAFDYGVSYRYRKIVRRPELAYFNGRLINLHISLLPWNRGADPNIWSYLENTPRGVSIHEIDEGIDTGNVLVQREVDIDLETATLKTSWETLTAAVESLFIANSCLLLAGTLPSLPQQSKGSFHRNSDTMHFSHLWEKYGWDTPVRNLLNKACA